MASGAERSPPARELSCTPYHRTPPEPHPWTWSSGGLERDDLQSTALPRFLLLYAAMYAAFGVASPFFPALVNARGVPRCSWGSC